jgi:hypothetical protein
MKIYSSGEIKMMVELRTKRLAGQWSHHGISVLERYRYRYLKGQTGRQAQQRNNVSA